MSQQLNKISGYTIARNVIKFKYPIRECLTALRPICDDIVLAYDPFTDDGTDEIVKKLTKDLDLTIFESRWNMDNINKGSEIAIQTDIALNKCHNDWKLYLQLDEAFHEEDIDKIKELPIRAETLNCYGIDFQRIYFYRNLSTIRRDWTTIITRLTRGQTHTYLQGDGMSCVPVKKTWSSHFNSDVWMYHYSRFGNADLISKRILNIDTFFHSKEDLPKESEISPYDFITREYDSYAFTENPQENNTELLKYEGSHPKSFAELYKEYK